MQPWNTPEFRDAHRISPSQIETGRLCLRKWAWNKLEGRVPPPNAYAQRGTEAHSVLELWQKDKKPIDFSTDVGKIVSAGIKFLPTPGSHETERNFVFLGKRATYHGLIDLRGPVRSPVQELWDHKTTSNLIWMKTPEILRSDPQANIYAMAALDEAAEIKQYVERVEQNWIYYRATPQAPKSRKVQLHVIVDTAVEPPEKPEDVLPEHFGVMSHSELLERFEEIEDTAESLLRLYYEKPSPKDVPYNAAACSAYGGCPYKGNPCTLTYSERWTSMEAQEEKKMTLAEKMRAKLGGGKAQAETTTTAKATATASAAAPKTVSLVNPPEQIHGVDPDEPKGTKTDASGKVTSYGRTEIAAMAMQGLVASRVYSPTSNRYTSEVAAEAVQLADALLAALAK